MTYERGLRDPGGGYEVESLTVPHPFLPSPALLCYGSGFASVYLRAVDIVIGLSDFQLGVTTVGADTRLVIRRASRLPWRKRL